MLSSSSNFHPNAYIISHKSFPMTIKSQSCCGYTVSPNHQERAMTLEEEEQIKNIFVQRFGRDINADLRPIAYAEYKDYILWFVNSMDPGDMQA